MDIPPSVRIPICIEQGSVFNFTLITEDTARQTKNRFFVVMNQNPKTDLVLLMLSPTTQIDKKNEYLKRSGITEETLVIVTPKEYSGFTKDSAFNCNDVFDDVKISDLIKKIEDCGSMNYPKMSITLINKLKKAIKKSPRVSTAVKNLL